jgi:hypothetical protein
VAAGYVPELPGNEFSYAFAPDGATAVIVGTNCQIVAVLPVRATGGGGFTLGRALTVFTAHHGGLAPWSVALTPTRVTWRTARGKPESALRSGGSTGTLAFNGGC